MEGYAPEGQLLEEELNFTLDCDGGVLVLVKKAKDVAEDVWVTIYLDLWHDYQGVIVDDVV